MHMVLPYASSKLSYDAFRIRKFALDLCGHSLALGSVILAQRSTRRIN